MDLRIAWVAAPDRGAPTRGELREALLRPLGLFTAKVRIALGEKDLAYEKIAVPGSLERRYEPHQREVVRLNPKARVSVLVDGDVVVYDSTEIVEYVKERQPECIVIPAARCRGENPGCRPMYTLETRILAHPLIR